MSAFSEMFCEEIIISTGSRLRNHLRSTCIRIASRRCFADRTLFSQLELSNSNFTF